MAYLRLDLRRAARAAMALACAMVLAAVPGRAAAQPYGDPAYGPSLHGSPPANGGPPAGSAPYGSAPYGDAAYGPVSPHAPAAPHAHAAPPAPAGPWGSAAPEPIPPGMLPPPSGPLPPASPNLLPEPDMVVDVRVEGNTAVGVDKIRPHLQTRRGRPLDFQVVEEDVRRLIRTRHFVNVKPYYQRTAEGVVVVFQLVERPVLRYVKYIGNEKVRDRILAEQTNLKVGDALDPYAVEEGRRKIEQFYLEKGHSKVQVTVLEGTRPRDAGAVYRIHEGPSQKIRSVKFVGHSVVSGARLRTLIDSKPPILWVWKGFAEREKIDTDVEKLTAYYRSLGYFRAEIDRELVFDDKNKWATLTFVINEGPRYVVRDVRFYGNQKFTTEEIAAELKLGAGHYFDQTSMNRDMAAIEDLYGSQGYVFADIRPEPIFQDQPGELDLVYNIDEGSRARVGRINVRIEGEHPHTRHMTVLTRVDLRPGDILDIRKLRASERRLKSSGLFMNEPAQGVTPKIVFSLPDGDESIYAERPRRSSPSFRGQSPDDVATRSLDSPLERAPVQPQSHHAHESAPDAAQPAGIVGRVVSFEPLPDDPARYRSTGVWAEEENPAYHASASWVAPRPIAPEEPHQAPRPLAPQSLDPQLPAGVYGNPVRRPPVEYDTPASTPMTTARPVSEPLIVRGQWSSSGGEPLPSTNPRYPSYAPSAPAPRPVYQAPQDYRSPNYTSPPYATAPPPALPADPYAGNAPNAAGPPYGGGDPYSSGTGYGTGTPTASGAWPAPPMSGPPLLGSGAGTPLPAPGGYVQPPYGGEPIAPGAVYPEGGYNFVDPEPTIEVPLDVVVRETTTGRLMLGVGVNSDLGVVGSIVLDEQNFDWRRWPRSFREIVDATAWRGAGQQLRIEALPGNQFQRYMINFREPYLFDSPISFGISGYFYDRRFRDWDEQRMGGRPSLGYQFTPDLSGTISVRGENVNLRNPAVPTPADLADALGNNDVFVGRVALAHDTRDSAFMATEGHLIELGFEQGFGTYDWPRATLEFNQYFLLLERPDGSGRQTVRVRFDVGFSGTQTPIFERFFAGGFSTLRGFDFRGASPLDMNVTVGGIFQFLGTVEYMFPITADDMLRGVLFCDYGTVERSVRFDPDTFRVAPGFGLRINVPALGPAPIALDFTVPIAHAPGDDIQNFSFYVGFNY